MNKNLFTITCLSCLTFGMTLQTEASTYKRLDGYFSNQNNAEAASIFNNDNYSEVYYSGIDIQAGRDSDRPTIITNNTNLITNRIEMMNILPSLYTGNIELTNNGIIRDFNDEDPYENTILEDPLEMEGTITTLVTDASMLKLIATGSFTNNGILGLDIYMNNGGTVTLNNGSSMAGVSASKGDMYVNGAIQADGTFTLGQNLVMHYEQGSFIDMQGNLLTADDALTVYVHDNDYQEGEEIILFRNVAEGSTTEFNVIIIDDAGNKIGTAIGTVGTSIPEPATATLSLLALAALSARRRRS